MGAECDHDFEHMGSGYYRGQRPGWSFDQFFCKRCLLKVAVDARGNRTENPDPQWYELDRPPRSRR